MGQNGCFFTILILIKSFIDIDFYSCDELFTSAGSNAVAAPVKPDKYD